MSIINPALDRFPKEGAIIGRLLLGYSELEVMLAISTTLAVDADRDDILRAFYRTRSEYGRISLADALLKRPLEKLGLSAEFESTRGALDHCRNIRNQYAHCQWAVQNGLLFFADLDKSAKQDKGFDLTFRYVDLRLLNLQEAYFDHTRQWMFHIEHEIKRHLDPKVSSWPKPNELAKPKLYNEDVHYTR